jgi:glucose/arabinose dehydrogenase
MLGRGVFERLGFVAGLAASAACILLEIDWIRTDPADPIRAFAYVALAHAEPQTNFGWLTVARGFSEVTDIQFVPGGVDTALVLQKSGAARFVSLAKRKDVAPPEAAASPVVLEVAVRTQSEMGLLGLAFHPKYETNGLFYLNYDPDDGERRTRIAEWQLPKDRLGKERAHEVRILLEVAQPYPNHKAGQLLFGPDGMLYVGFGDGGSGGDPQGNAQNLSSLLGKMLRIDVTRRDGDRPYAIPSDNPFTKRPGARPEIWAYGLRNPWRYSFDPRGRLIVADVGQNTYEEIDWVERGLNYGWNLREARHCFPAEATCTRDGLVEPIFEYDHSLGLSVTGGFVYTGSAMPALKGKYVFADFSSGRVWSLEVPKVNATAVRAKLLGQWPRAISTFGRNLAGEIFAGDFGSGDILELAP